MTTKAVKVVSGSASLPATDNDIQPQHRATAPFHKLFDTLKECLRLEDVIIVADSNRELADRLASEVEKLHATLKDHDNSRALVVEDFERRYEKWKAREVTLLDINKELEKRNSELADHNQRLLKRISELEGKLSNSTNDLDKGRKEAADLKLERDNQVEKIKRLEKLPDQIRSSKDSLSARERDVKKLQQLLAGEIKKSKDLTEEHKLLQQGSEKFERQIRDYEEELRKWKRYKSDLHNDDTQTLHTKISDLCVRTHTLATKYFCTEIPATFTKNIQRTYLKELKRVRILTDKSSVPTSNTDAAKDFRKALALATLAHLMMEHAFRPTQVRRDHKIHRLLLEQAISDSDRESLCRALILGLSDDDDDNNNEIDDENPRRQRKFRREVEELLDPMLPVDASKDFDSALESLMCEARKLWDYLQHHILRIEASVFKKDYSDWGTFSLATDTRHSSDQDVSLGQDSSRDKVLLVVFPVFFSVTEQNCFDTLHRGFAVRESQIAINKTNGDESSFDLGKKFMKQRKPI